MNPQLEQIEAQIRAAQERLRALARTAPPETWSVRPREGRWSIADNVEHLNRTAEAFLPLLSAALKEADAASRRPDRHYHRDLRGWLLSVVMPPPVRLMRVKTTPRFYPSATTPSLQLMKSFDALQEQLIRCLHEADGLPLNDIRIQSPFSASTRYNAYSCFVIVARHEHRHLWQAERTAEEVMRPAATHETLPDR